MAALSVLVHHAAFVSGATKGSRFGMFFARMDVGVSVFFVLSGFLLFLPIVDKGVQETVGSRERILRFWQKRFWRIFPSYWLVLWVAVAFGATRVDGPEGFVLSSLLIHVYHPDHVLLGLTQSWSLAAEVVFYFLLPLIALFIGRLAHDVFVNRRMMKMMIILLILYVSSVVFRYLASRFEIHPFLSPRMWFPGHMDQFVLGMSIAVLLVWSRSNATIHDITTWVSRRATQSVCLGVLLFVFLSTQLELQRGLLYSSFAKESVRQFLYGVIAIFMVAPLAWGTTASSLWSRLLGTRVLVFLGTISYGIYLWHNVFLTGEVSRRLFGFEDFTGNLLRRVVLASLFSVAAATLTYRFVEQPLAKRMSRSR